MEQVHFKPFPSPLIYVEVAQKCCGLSWVMWAAGLGWNRLRNLEIHFDPEPSIDVDVAQKWFSLS